MPHPTPIKIHDIRDSSELARIAREVAATKTSRQLVLDNQPVAVIAPVKAKKRREKTQNDYKAFRSAAGSWRDVDIENFKAGVYASRRMSTRPPVKL